ARAPGDRGRSGDWAWAGGRPGFAGLRARLPARGAVASDITADTVAERLRYTLAARPRLALDDASVPTVRDWARTVRPEIDARAPPLVHDLTAQLPYRALALFSGPRPRTGPESR